MRPQAQRERFRTILSDPCNDDIPRVENAGDIVDGNITMHNGIKIKNNSYYGVFSDIFKINGGVHEPQEEKVFMEVLKDIDEGVMIELGAYWGFYSLWFNQFVKKPKNYLIEPIPNHIQLGKDNFEINNAEADFTHGSICPYVDNFCKFKPSKNTPIINIDDFVKNKGIEFIELLHCDIQAAEYSMFMGAKETFANKKVKYVFISTHNDPLHSKCTKFLIDNGYEIIASANVAKQSFSGDGIIVARLKELDGVQPIELSDKSKTPLKSMKYVDTLLKNKGL